MMIDDGIRCLALFGSKKHDAIYFRIRYLINLECSMTYFFSHYCAKDKFFSYNYLTIEKRLTLYNVIILITSVK